MKKAEKYAKILKNAEILSVSALINYNLNVMKLINNIYLQKTTRNEFIFIFKDSQVKMIELDLIFSIE
jgi:hypothetical protein